MYGILMSALIGYLLGSIPFGLLVGRICGIDIRQHGSGNIGATNVLRTLGKKWGYLVFALDAAKGLTSVLIAKNVFGLDLAPPGAHVFSAAQLGVVAALSCIIGHNYPVWLRFKGGKGIATSAGVSLGLMPWAILTSAAVWIVMFYATRYVSLASIIAASLLPVAEWVIGRQFDAVFWFSCAVAFLAVVRHRANIKRLLAGTENRFEKKKK
jgi:glycerol-3-phosphate acyltransferase PlsY